MDFFTSNGADKPEEKRAKAWYRTGAGFLMILTLLVAAIGNNILGATRLTRSGVNYQPVYP